jgi:hypothetical protein
MRLGVGLRWIILAALSATACLPMFAGAMINFSCEVGDGTGPGQSVSGPNPCSLTGTGSEGLESQATAQFVRTPVLPLDNFQSTTSFSASVAASAYALCGFTQTMDCLISGASATITWETFATTAGPERLGYIDLSFVGSFDYPGEELAFGGNNEQVGQYGASENEAGNSIMLPFTLGVPFEMMLSIGINAATAEPDPMGIISSGADLSFQLFEADGVTPVEISAVPEPGTPILVASGLIFWVVRKRSLNVKFH